MKQHRIHLAMGSIGHPCSSRFRAVYIFDDCSNAERGSVFDQAILLLPCWANNHYPRPGLNVVIKPYKLALLPTASIDKAFLVIGMQFSIGKMIKKGRQNSITLFPIDRTDYHFLNRWA